MFFNTNNFGLIIGIIGVIINLIGIILYLLFKTQISSSRKIGSTILINVFAMAIFFLLHTQNINNLAYVSDENYSTLIDKIDTQSEQIARSLDAQTEKIGSIINDNTSTLVSKIDTHTEDITRTLNSSINTSTNSTRKTQNAHTEILESSIDENTETLDTNTGILNNINQNLEQHVQEKSTGLMKPNEEQQRNEADTFFNLGLAQYKELDARVSKRYFTNALKLYRKLAETDKVYNIDLAMTLHNLSFVNVNLQKNRKSLFFITWGTKKILSSYQESLVILCNLSNIEPNTYSPYVSQILLNMSYVYFEDIQKEENVSSRSEAITLMKEYQNTSSYKTSIQETLAILKSCGDVAL